MVHHIQVSSAYNVSIIIFIMHFIIKNLKKKKRQSHCEFFNLVFYSVLQEGIPDENKRRNLPFLPRSWTQLDIQPNIRDVLSRGTSDYTGQFCF